MGDNAATHIDEFGFLRTRYGARILANPASEYYNPDGKLPVRNYFFPRNEERRKPFRPNYEYDELRSQD